MQPPLFSLIVATVGRTDPLERFFASLHAQKNRSFEVIVVDQNEDPRLAPIIESHWREMPIVWVASRRGLSRARNVGLALARGQVVAIPDDDCWYQRDCLERVATLLRQAPERDGVTGVAADLDGTRVGSAQWDSEAGPLNRSNVWRRGCSTTIFLRRSAMERTGQFDETLGAGSGTPYGAAEETDYLLRALQQGCKVWYDPDLVIHHEQSVSTFDAQASERAFRYGMGIGYVLRKHRYPLRYCAGGWLRSFGGVVLSLARMRFGQARFYRAALAGKFLGWLRTSPE